MSAAHPRARQDLAPWWRYYGAKYRIARRYPPPRHAQIIEPFAGAAGYATRYPDAAVLLIDRDPIIVGVWQYLIHVRPSEILALPDVAAGEDVQALTAVPQEARWLMGFWCNVTSRPVRTPSRWMREPSPHHLFWGDKVRQRLAAQVDRIRHWRVQFGAYTDAPDVPATWFIDPPYEKLGRHYRYRPVEYTALATWCQARQGQVIVCEQAGATWLPFEPLPGGPAKTARKGRPSWEVIWTRHDG
jgi:hypothetical protein